VMSQRGQRGGQAKKSSNLSRTRKRSQKGREKAARSNVILDDEEEEDQTLEYSFGHLGMSSKLFNHSI
jgi:hypothetical protein